MEKKLKFYDVKLDYIEYLKKFENRISDASSENLKNRRKFIGILIEIENVNYVAPLTSPKEKHIKLKDTLDFLKIKEGEYGAINFNNMFPVPNELIKEFKIQDEQDVKYKSLLEKQLSWCNEEANKNKILKVSKKLYKLYIGGKLPAHVENRCCDFEILEKQCLKYIEKLNQERIENIKNIIKANGKNQYNCLTGNQINIPERENKENRWIYSKTLEKESLKLKEGSEPTEALLCNINENGILETKIVKYYNLSDVVVTKELERKLVPMKEKIVKIEKDKGMER